MALAARATQHCGPRATARCGLRTTCLWPNQSVASLLCSQHCGDHACKGLPCPHSRVSTHEICPEGRGVSGARSARVRSAERIVPKRLIDRQGEGNMEI